MINLIITDDQEMIREGLKMILSFHKDINIIAEAENGKNLLDILKTKTPDVILMDIRMPIMDGIEATRLVKQNYPHIKVIILTTFDEDEYIFQGLKYGGDGYILKDSNSDEIFAAIKASLNGYMHLTPKVTSKVIKAFNSLNPSSNMLKSPTAKNNIEDQLTPRELDVAKHVLLGESNKTISKNLFVTEGTVKNYVSKILEKLSLQNRTELVIYMKDHGYDDI